MSMRNMARLPVALVLMFAALATACGGGVQQIDSRHLGLEVAEYPLGGCRRLA